MNLKYRVTARARARFAETLFIQIVFPFEASNSYVFNYHTFRHIIKSIVDGPKDML